MSVQKEKKGARPVSIDRLLRVNNQIDIIFNDTLFSRNADVRASHVVDINYNAVVLAQTSPPILKSMINKPMEATFVNFDLASSERTRWGWDSHILGLNNEYVPEGASPDTPPLQVVFIAMPARGSLRTSNVRLDYRLTVGPQDKILVNITPSAQGAKLVNFSAGGAMIAVSGAPELQIGSQVYLNLVFPWPGPDSSTTIKSRAEVVRVDYARGEGTTHLGLHFQEMETEITRVFQKIINHYMLAEQRARSSRA